MCIRLMRHGKPDCNRKIWLTFSQFRHWIGEYKNVNLDENFVFPNSFKTLFSVDKIVFSSDMPRSVQTAQGLTNSLISDSVFDEVDFSLPKMFLPIKLRPMMWMTLCRVIWALGFHCQVESVKKTKKRAKDAAERLIESAKKQVDVILIGHGFFNYFIAVELRRKGWVGPMIPYYGYSEGSSYRTRTLMKKAD